MTTVERLTDVERCEQTDMLTDQCHHCRPKTSTPSWPAAWAGLCATCGSEIAAGDPVKWAEDGQGVQHSRH